MSNGVELWHAPYIEPNVWPKVFSGVGSIAGSAGPIVIIGAVAGSAVLTLGTSLLIAAAAAGITSLILSLKDEKEAVRQNKLEDGLHDQWRIGLMRTDDLIKKKTSLLALICTAEFLKAHPNADDATIEKDISSFVWERLFIDEKTGKAFPEGKVDMAKLVYNRMHKELDPKFK